MKFIQISLVLASFSLFSQSFIDLSIKNIERGTIYKSDKTQIEGKITSPLSPQQGNIKIRTSGKNIKTKSHEIDSIVFDNQAKTTIIYSPTISLSNYNNIKNKKPEWLEVVIKGEFLLYKNTYLEHRKEYSKSTTQYYLKRKNEPFPALIGVKTNEPIPSTNDRSFNKNLEKYFSDQPEILQKIKEKEYNLNEMHLLVNKYNELVNSKQK
ncbi:MAG: hypothetical protein Q4C98_01225 [Capnocytophaga sp.]|nr:hypothetical protein [Capnocytophaga sp.]